ncbi:MAG: glycosyltransferase family 2 protein [Deltaproteobacteria bacterium]|nr:glycosyltransferase family 2 protein [Deltaproteobacteria bacterium]
METSPPSDLSVIVVNYNTADFLVRCLNSIASQTQIDSEVIVVDNASQDNSLDLIRNNFPWVIVIANERNLGFARANNLALKTCRADYVYFLNPDTEVMGRCFRNMIDFMDQRPEVGLAGTRIVNPDGSPQSSIEKRYPGEKYAKQELRDLKGNIAWVMGASMIARRGIVEDLGGFDEDFFLYGEEQDLCLRIRKAGWTIEYINESAVVHWGGQSERKNLPAEVWKKKFQAELVFYRKHYSERAIRGIKRANLIKAFWRILILKLTIPFCSDKNASLKKLEKYRLVLKAFGTRDI